MLREKYELLNFKETCFCFVHEEGRFDNPETKRYAENMGKRVKYTLEDKMVYENGVYKCKFVCQRKFKFFCEISDHLNDWLFMDDWEHWDDPDRDMFNCGMDDPDNNVHRKKKGDIWRKDLSEQLDDAKNFVDEQVKNIITKICCCQEETSLFCMSVRHPGKKWKRCCRKCEQNKKIKLPVAINGIYVKLPDNMFVFSKVFRSFIEITDCTSTGDIRGKRKIRQRSK